MSGKPKFVYANEMGMLFRFTEKQFKAFAKSGFENEWASASDFGVMVGLVHNVTDWTKNEYRDHF